ncbi:MULTISPECIES: NAD(+) kinase [unclassified Colwellia]|uniref:NAD(+) kinase n=1 Tax=unclassified Colwellia TaxID=196834 RepID=UPI0015F579A8|nr:MULTISPECIES: NAD(+) kinase [unclassified Colwellia]MBA6231791.1 NAD(+) kinase [Colwellia sp. MB02u-7]MBA6235746.1 NAD(+) kinase [Colwellia sp. MB02u-11]MBA6255025.1 NAD(+) kinase [Colwellia sp. MB3u-28]MBA6259024.1 NAD(+) kinase [Colwellia sp. MB3u-41]MBA6298835.1 NAD(+) kinase [Colwellia sp. MB3u-22]
MSKIFNTIGLIGKPNHEGASATITALYQFLTEQNYKVLIESSVAPSIDIDKLTVNTLMEIGEQADLAIVVGGDGYMLGAARVLSCYDVGVIGVNRGNLGFLTDLSPDELLEPLQEILQGKSRCEQRFIIEAEVYRHGKLKSSNSAVNEAVLHAGKVASMIEFEVYIDGSFMFSQRSDGLIVSTPTGSTAYSMSAGGPILTPNLNALSLVPMFPHTLTSRPIVVDGNSEIKLVLANENYENLQVSCDGHVILAVMPGDEVIIRKSAYTLRLIHPLDHDYFNVLRSKLGWGNKLY